VLYELVGYTEGSLEVIFGMFECCSIYHDYMLILAVLLVDERGEGHDNAILTRRCIVVKVDDWFA
jgi:hypothetical protein